MAKVVRLGPGGGAAVEESGLSVEQAKRLAAHLAAAGEPRGYCWCVSLDEEERVRDDVEDLEIKSVFRD
jgi:hypothetical protein